jgi:Domain of unknown function (DUF955).
MDYETLLKEADSMNLVVKEKPLRAHAGRIKGNRIAIKADMTTTEKACVLAEELGHYYTTVGNILDQSDYQNQKQELRARLIAYNKMIGLLGIIKAYQKRCQTFAEMADYLNVPESFLKETLERYRTKYGCKVEVDNYVILFEPQLAVIEKI